MRNKEFQRYLDTAINAGIETRRREVARIDGHLDQCQRLMERLDELESIAESAREDDEEEEEEEEATTVEEVVDEYGALSTDDSPRTIRRQTVCAPSSPYVSVAGEEQTRLSLSADPNASFTSIAAASSVYSQHSPARDADYEPLIFSPPSPPPLPVRASSRQPPSAQLTRSFNQSYIAPVSGSPLTTGSTHEFHPSRRAPVPPIRGMQSQRYPPLPQYPPPLPPLPGNRDKALPPISQRMYTPRTASTTELLGNLTPDLFELDHDHPYTATARARTGSGFFLPSDPRRRGFIMLDEDEFEYESAEKVPPSRTTSGFKWPPHLKIKKEKDRRTSKADELLGLANARARPQEAMGASLRSLGRVESGKGSSEEDQAEGGAEAKKGKLMSKFTKWSLRGRHGG